jgi:hypothetical protein
VLNLQPITLQAVFRSFSIYGILSLELGLAVLVGLGLMSIGLNGAAWILAGIASGAFVFSSYRLLAYDPIRPNRNVRKVGQLIIGLSIGLSLQQSNLETVSSWWFILLGLPLFLMLAGIAIAFLYAPLEKIDRLTAVLATTPGNIGVMATVAADYSKNSALVTIVQLMRFTTVIFVMPLIANVALAGANHPTIPSFIHQVLTVSWHELKLSILIISAGLLVAYLSGKLRVPMAVFLSAIAVGLGFDLLPLVLTNSPTDFQLPLFFNLLGQILLGITIGEYWGINPKLKLLTVVRAIVPVVLMLGAGLLAAGLIHQLTEWDWLTCLLVTAPGGSPEMIWIAIALNQDSDIITAGHVIRLLTINLSLPLVISIGSYLQNQRLEATD